jgi:myo-inositol-1(or 4)-monophosphatase
MQPMLNTAVKAARHAGDFILRTLEHMDSVDINTSERRNFLNKVQKATEEEIIGMILKAYPDHSIIAKESGRKDQSDEYRWTIDPLNGTTNFIHGFPQFSVTISLEKRGELESAVIYDPLKQEMFTAMRGRGARLDNRRIRVSKCNHLQNALLGSRFPANKDLIQPYIRALGALSKAACDIRQAGATSLDLAYIAAGRLDGFWQLGLESWDMTAGILLITEAGGVVGDLNGEQTHMKTGNLIAGSPKVYKALLEHTIQTVTEIE